MNTDLIAYYRDRAKEYEKIYDKPERQESLKEAGLFLQHIFNKEQVFEIACGTGYWTEIMAQTASEILASDINQSVLDIAANKSYPANKVRFEPMDVFNLPETFSAKHLFGGFIWSHIYLQELDHFLDILKRTIAPGGKVVLMDNLFVEGSNLPLTHTDDEGNTFQTRQLENGTSHLVLKNFPSEQFLLEKFSRIATTIEIIQLDYYWILVGKMKD